MIVMDLKGGSWVGDMYQKFEAMCVEVEEAMYEDTFKYVENHVRTVGKTVKKFYSDVVQDLLPPSPSNSVKSEDSLSYIFRQSDKISKKSKVLDENESEKLVKNSSVAYINEDNLNNTTSCSPICSVIKPCRPMSVIEHDLTEDSDVDKVNIRDLSGGPNTTDLSLSSMEADLITTSTSVNDTNKVDKELTTIDTETSTPFLVSEYRKGEGDEEGFVVEHLNEVELEESCVLVDKYDSFSKSNLQSVQKSYKKKIRDVLSPRQWSKSNRDQEEPFNWYNQRGKSSVPTSNVMKEELCNSPISGSFESDWELL